ncbi:MAG: prepilin peptidase [Candidatus Nomurabacteria bacterium]|jgi:prepilin signal peptidase PulO-like enzyme (type II secretory pathway)|nr:prepilin peptidase [Candidatus Nomurabacteria bacterium]
MTDVIIVVFLFILGAGVGSFVSSSQKTGRSKCSKCGRVLKWHDLVPIVSFGVLRGKCRYCSKPIKKRYPSSEILFGALFGISYLNWPGGAIDTVLGGVSFALWLVIATLFLSLFLSDLYYQKLPNRLILIISLFLLVFTVLTEIVIEQKICSEVIISHLLALFPITVLFSFLHLISKGKIIGMGDAKLGIPIAILLTWQGSLAVLFLANILAALIVFPALSKKKIKPNTKIAFGPFLILATFLVFFMMEFLMNFF